MLNANESAPCFHVQYSATWMDVVADEGGGLGGRGPADDEPGGEAGGRE